MAEEFVSLKDASYCNIFIVETHVIFASEDVHDRALIQYKVGSVFYVIDHFQILDVGLEAWNNW